MHLLPFDRHNLRYPGSFYGRFDDAEVAKPRHGSHGSQISFATNYTLVGTWMEWCTGTSCPCCFSHQFCLFWDISLSLHCHNVQTLSLTLAMMTSSSLIRVQAVLQWCAVLTCEWLVEISLHTQQLSRMRKHVQLQTLRKLMVCQSSLRSVNLTIGKMVLICQQNLYCYLHQVFHWTVPPTLGNKRGLIGLQIFYQPRYT